VDMHDIRRNNLRLLVEEHSNGNLSHFAEVKLDSLASYKGLQHVTGPGGVRNLGSPLARKIELPPVSWTPDTLYARCLLCPRQRFQTGRSGMRQSFDDRWTTRAPAPYAALQDDRMRTKPSESHYGTRWPSSPAVTFAKQPPNALA